MLLTWSSGAIGCATLTVIGTVLPFSTKGGMSSLTLPILTAADPVTLRIADASMAGVASAGRSVTASTIAPPARVRNLRRVDCIAHDGIGTRCLRVGRADANRNEADARQICDPSSQRCPP